MVKPEVKLNPMDLVNLFKYYLSKLILNPDQGKLYALGFVCLLIVGCIVLKNLFRYLALYSINPLRNFVVRDLRQSLYNKILHLPLSFFSDERKGDLITKMGSDVGEIEWSILRSLETIFREPITIFIYLGTLIYISPTLSLYVFLLLPLTGLIVGRIAKSLKRKATETQTKLGQLISLFEETLSGLRIIKAFNAEEKMSGRFANDNESLSQLGIKTNMRRDLSSPLTETLSVLVLVVVLWFGGNMVIDGKLEASVFVGYIALFSQIISPAKSFSDAFYLVSKGAASAERIEDILHTENNIINKPDALFKSSFDKGIEFKNVWFKYEDKWVLQDINLSIKKGQSVALVGPSGGGKSTLADFIPRFYDVTKGEVLLDGINLRDFNIESLRNLMGVVTQESLLFNDTIANNISFGLNNITRDQIIQAAQIANAHEFIIQTENGYDTNIGDRGNKLSGGQRQRLSIARAILKNPELLILDEATSALDTGSERLVQEAINKLMEHRTSVVIAHRLSTIQHADLIVVIEAGKIVQQGPHQDLIAKEGLYRQLWEMQTG